MQRLRYLGFYVGPRHSNRNMAFIGTYMVAEHVFSDSTDDARTGGYCVVGDNLDELVTDAFNYFCTE